VHEQPCPEILAPVIRQSTVTVNVAANAAATVKCRLERPHYRLPFSLCEFQQIGSVSVIDVQSAVNQALGKIRLPMNLNGDGVVNLVDVQIEINAVVTLSCAAK